MLRSHYPAVLAAALVALVLGVFAGVFWGTAPMPFEQKLAVLFRLSEARQNLSAIIWSWRMPRVLACVLAGGALSISGLLIQTTLRNPLADPYLLGLSSGASAAAVAAIIWLPGTLVAALGLDVIAFLGAALAFALTLLIAFNKDSPVDRLIVVLAGVAVSLLFQSVTAFLLHVADPFATREALFWLMGSAAGTKWSDLPLLAMFTLLLSTVFFFQSRQLDTLLMGDTRARSLGVSVTGIRLAVFIAVTVLTGLSVSILGIVGFIGLIVPHLARQLVGSAHKTLIPVTVVLGALVLVIADLLCRIVLAPGELPLAVLLALFATPPFVFFLRKARHAG